MFGRMANKRLAFEGRLMPGKTTIRILNNNSKNVELNMIWNKDQFALIRIQFKDASIGSRFIAEVGRVTKN